MCRRGLAGCLSRRKTWAPPVYAVHLSTHPCMYTDPHAPVYPYTSACTSTAGQRLQYPPACVQSVRQHKVTIPTSQCLLPSLTGHYRPRSRAVEHLTQGMYHIRVTPHHTHAGNMHLPVSSLHRCISSHVERYTCIENKCTIATYHTWARAYVKECVCTDRLPDCTCERIHVQCN